jgi:hypothetical protein
MPIAPGADGNERVIRRAEKHADGQSNILHHSGLPAGRASREALRKQGCADTRAVEPPESWNDSQGRSRGER